MARYRKIDPRMWGDEKFRSLSKPQPNAQTLWQYLLTGPHTNSCPGLFNVGEMALAEKLAWPLEQFRERFRELLNKHMIKADFESQVILIPRAIHYDPPDNPNVIKHWGKMFDEIPECELKMEYYQILKEYIKGLRKELSEPSMKRFEEAFASGFTNSLTIPEPFLNHNHKDTSKPLRGQKIPRPTNPQIKEFIDFYFKGFKNRFGVDPIIEGGKDGSLIKDLLAKIDYDELKILLVKFFESDDPFIQKSGYTIGAFKSQVQKLRIGPKPSMGKSIDAAELWLRKQEERDAKEGLQKISYGPNENKGESSGNES